MHYCIFRTDRIGDLILTLPLAEAVKRHDPSAHVSFCVQQYAADIARLSPHVDEIIAIGDRDLPGGLRDFASGLRQRRIDAAVFAYPRPRLAMAAAMARIPRRCGSAYRAYSLLFTDRVREHRRHARRHERDFNLSLLGPLGVPCDEPPLPALLITESLRGAARERLRAAGVDDGETFVVLHPGSGGSAKNWDASRFGALAKELGISGAARHFLVTGTSTERDLMEAVREASGNTAILLPPPVELGELAALLSLSSLCVANSTGPLHMAAAAGAPVLGLYPFERVCNPRRWGPLTRRGIVLTPVKDASCRACAAEQCPDHDRMSRIPVSAAIDAAERLLAGTEADPAA